MPLYEFAPSFTVDQGDLTLTASGSGVHLNKSVTIDLGILDRTSGVIEGNADLLANPYVDNLSIDILNINGSAEYEDFITDYKSNVFTFTEYDNINVFGEYTKDFGVRVVVSESSETHTSEFYFYGNHPEFSGITVQDSTGTTSHSSSQSSKTAVNASGQTGVLTSTVTFNNDIAYINFDRLEIYSSTSSSEFADQINPNPVFSRNLTNQSVQSFDINEGELPNGDPVYLHYVPYSNLGSGAVWTVGPYTFEDNPIATNQYITKDDTGDFGGNQDLSDVLTNGNSAELGFTVGPSEITGDLTVGGDIITDSTTTIGTCGQDLKLKGDFVSLQHCSGQGTPQTFLQISNSEQVEFYRQGNFASGLYINPSQSIQFGGKSKIFTDNQDGISSLNLESDKILFNISGSSNEGTEQYDLRNIVGSFASAILLGTKNRIFGDYDAIAAGTENVISGDDTSPSDFGFIGAGSGNDITGSSYASTVGGHDNDIFSSDYSIIGGGYQNLIQGGTAGFVGGGFDNTLAAGQSVIAGGVVNLITGGGYSFIGGGEANEIYSAFGAILGGENNTVSGNSSTIVAGQSNKIYGDNSFIAGGVSSKVSGDYANAIGRRIQIQDSHDGALVLADGQNRDHVSNGAHSATLDFDNGVYISTGDLIVEESVTMGGNTVLTGITSGDITGALGYTPLSSETDDQTLDEVLAQGNTSTRDMSVGDISGTSLDITTDVTVTGDVEADEFIGDLRGAVSFRAKAGEALSAGDVVYISGIDGNTTVVAKADADDSNKMPAFGVSKETVNANANVRVVNFGSIGSLDTSAYSEGDELFVSDVAGQLTGIAPTGEFSALQKMAKVTRSHGSSGSITVMGAGRTNAVPNLNEGRLFVGDSSNQAVADGTIHVDIANSKVGIGTTSPVDTLDIKDSNPRVRLIDTTVANDPAAYMWNSEGSLLFRADVTQARANTYIRFDIDQSEKLRITDGGNVGIGTTSPSKKLHVDGDFRFDLANGSLTSTVFAGTDRINHSTSLFFSAAGNFILHGTNSTIIKYGSGNGTNGWTFTSQGHLRDYGSATERLDIGGSSNLVRKIYTKDFYASNSVGVGYTSPSYDLDVSGSGHFLNDLVVDGNLTAGPTTVTNDDTGVSDVFSVDGVNGRLFGVTDEVTGTVFSVNDAAGLPIVEVESTSGYDKITIGEYGSDALVISGTNSALFNVDVDITGGLDVTGDITMGGETVLTGITSGDITGALGYTPLSSETDDQTLQEILDATPSATGTINVDVFSGESGVFHNTLRVGDAGFVDFPSDYDTLQVGTSSSSINGHILIRGRESSLTFRGSEGADKAFTIKEDAGNLTFYGDTTLSGTAGNSRFTVLTGQSYFTDLVGVRGNGAKPQFYLASIGGGAQNKATHFYQPTNSADFRIAVDGGQNGTIGDDVFTIQSSTRNVGIGTTSPDHPLEVTGNIRGDSFTIGTDTVYSNDLNITNAGKIRIGNAEFFAKSTNDLNIYQGRAFVTNDGDFYVDTDTLYVDAANDRVGINNATPAYDLDVSGSGHFVNDLIVDEDITMGGNVVLTGITSGDITGALGYTPLSSETDDQTLDEVLTQGNVSSQEISVGSITGSGDFYVYGDAGGSLFWDKSENNFNITHNSDHAGLDIYTTGAVQPTTHQVKIGRNSNQYLGIRVDDNTSYIVHRQDETGGTLVRAYNQIWSSATSSKTWHWSLHDNAGNNASEKMQLNDSAELTLGGGSNTITNTKVGQWDSAYTYSQVGHLPLAGGTMSGNITMSSNSIVFDSNNSLSNSFIKSGGSLNVMLDSNNNTTNAALIVEKDSQTAGSGTELFRIQENGNVGIGTNSPAHKLDVNGSTHIAYNASNSNKFIQSNGSFGYGHIIPFNNGGNFEFNAKYTAGDSDYVFLVNDSSELLRIKEGGNVGIGTTSPNEKLEVDGNIRLTDFSDDIQFGNTANMLSYNQWLASASGGMSIKNSATASTGHIAFETSTGEKVRILRDGSVGIGTTSPSYKLTIDNGTIGSYFDNAATSVGRQVNMTSANTDGMGVFTQYHTNTDNTSDFFGKYGFEFEGGINNAASHFQVYVKDSTTPKMVVRGDGNVGIGTTSPSQKLHVDGDIRQEGASYSVNISGGANISGSNHLDLAANTSYLNLRSPNNSIFYGAGSDHVFRNGNATATYATIKTSGSDAGNVGIGTTSPSSLLHVYGATPTIEVEGSGNTSAKVDLVGTYTTWSLENQYINGATNDMFRIYNSQLAEDALTINRNTNDIGIGTTNPSNVLHVKSTTLNNGAAVKIENTRDGGADHGLEVVANGTSSSFAARIQQQGTGDILQVFDGSDEVFTILDGGNVGIGTTSPDYELHVIGTASFTDTVAGAYFEENASHESLKSMRTGFILVMDKDGELVPCTKENDTTVFGVAKKGYKQPIIMGAEPIKVTGPIKVGDFITTSNVEGHGMKAENPQFGTIIAQAMESGDGESYNIKAMIRKM